MNSGGGQELFCSEFQAYADREVTSGQTAAVLWIPRLSKAAIGNSGRTDCSGGPIDREALDRIVTEPDAQHLMPLTGDATLMKQPRGPLPMRNIDRVESEFGSLDYMSHAEALIMRDFVVRHAVRDILELGFYHGKSSAYFAAILEDLGEGHLVTIDRATARRRKPNIDQLLSTLGLGHRVTPIYAERSYTWELGKMIRVTPRPQYDLCYFDGGHTWDVTGFGFLLVDLLLRPGGWIIFDDLGWTIESAIPEMAKVPARWLECSADERTTPAVQLVFDILAPHLGYTNRRSVNGGRWGIARKPRRESRDRHIRSVSSRIRNLLAHRSTRGLRR